MAEPADPRLEDWRERLEPMLDGLRDLVPALPLDLSPGSLRHLEHFMLGDLPLSEGRAMAICGYLGEVLLTTGGGAWALDPGSDLPLAVLEVGGTVDLMMLVLDALTQRTGTVWSAEHERIQALATARRDGDPGWEPTRADRPARRA